MSNKTQKSKKSEQISVVVRCRPMTISEKSKTRKVINCDSKTKEVCVNTGNSQTKTYNFDKVFGEKSTQIEVYDAVVSSQMKDVLSGYNCTVLAYGQTGTGKTYTMEGEQSKESGYKWYDDPKSGIIPRALCHLFDLLEKMDVEYSVRVSLLEIYNEEIYDLLSTSDELPKLKIYDDSSRKGSIVISGLTEPPIRDRSQVYEILQQGSRKRRTAATNMNEFSSRSHSVFSVTVHTKDISNSNVEGDEYVKIGKLNLVDLAGSENIGRSGAVASRAREAGNINTSLLALGRCINKLVEKSLHIPYRESKLTRILQDSLGGSTKTSIIAAISPGHNNVEESISTLDYAFRSKNIHNRPKVNQKLKKKDLINEYNKEIEELRQKLEASRDKNGVYLPGFQYEEMKSKLEEYEATLKARVEEIDHYKESFDIKDEELTTTKFHLEETLEMLQVTKQKYAETKQKARALAEYGSDLYNKATQLNETMGLAEKDLKRTHDKVERVTATNAANIEKVQTFLSCMKSKVVDVNVESTNANEIVKEHVAANTQVLGEVDKLNQHILDSISTSMNLVKSDKLRIQENCKQAEHLSESCNKENENTKKCLQLTVELLNDPHKSDWMKNELMKLLTKVSKSSTNHQNTCSSSNNLVKEHGNKSRELCTSQQVVMHSLNGLVVEGCEVLQETKQQNNSHIQQLVSRQKLQSDGTTNLFAELKSAIDEQREAIRTAHEEQKEALRRSYEVQEHANKRIDELMADFASDLGQLNVKCDSETCEQATRYATSSERLHLSAMEVVTNEKLQISRSLEELARETDNVTSFVACHDQLMTSAAQKTATCTSEIEEDFAKMQEEAERKEDQQVKEISGEIDSISVGIEQSQDMFKKHIASLNDNFKAQMDDSKSNSSTLEEMQTAVVEVRNKVKKCENENADLCEQVTGWKINADEAHNEITNVIDQYKDNGMIPTRSTGDTPLRNTVYKYPKINENPPPVFANLDESILNDTEKDEVNHSDDDVIEVDENDLDESFTISDKKGIPLFGQQSTTKPKRSHKKAACQQKSRLKPPLEVVHRNDQH